MAGFILLRFREKRGYWPLMQRRKATYNSSDSEGMSSGDEGGIAYPEKVAKSDVRTVDS